ncbi:MAG: DUF1569 domain-containing protein [Cyclobacteriaceae bacterium]|nr:DUF1569 domain-containing protein [Cyclobacteriaceae bacterium]
MKTILNPADLLNLKERIAVLSTSGKRKWGTMTVEEMVVHCKRQLQLALGEIPSVTQGSALMRTSLVKWISFSALPWPKGSMTPNEMNKDKNSFQLKEIESEKSDLINYLDKVIQASTLFPHPFFGTLSRKEWGQFIYKHIDHHLKQFSQ